MLINICDLSVNELNGVFSKNMNEKILIDNIDKCADKFIYSDRAYKAYYDSKLLASIANYVNSGNRRFSLHGIDFDIQYHILRSLGSIESILDVNFEDRLDLLLYYAFKVPMEVTRSLPNYEIISRALLSLSLEDIGDFSLNMFSNLSDELNEFLAKCIENSDSSSRLLILEFIKGIHKRLELLMLSVSDYVFNCFKEMGYDVTYGCKGLTGFSLKSKSIFDKKFMDNLELDFNDNGRPLCSITINIIGGEGIC